MSPEDPARVKGRPGYRPQTSKPPEVPGVGGEWEMGIVLPLL